MFPIPHARSDRAYPSPRRPFHAKCGRARRTGATPLIKIEGTQALRYGQADGVGFEPTNPFGLPVFKTGAFDRSATHPGR